MKTSLKILMVEDSEDDSRLILRMLDQGGYAPSCSRVDTPEAFATPSMKRNGTA